MLLELQQALAQALYEEKNESRVCASVLERIRPLPQLAPRACLDLYRGSVAQVVNDALAEIFPVCAELVGEACFRSVSNHYMRSVGSRQADLARLGDAWPDFVRDQSFLSGVPYLADMGRLELGLHYAHAAPWPEPGVDPAKLSEAISNEPEAWRFVLPPSATLLGSPHPVLTVWEAHQDRRVDRGWKLDPAAPGEQMIICRHGTEIYADFVEPSLWPILQSIAAGEGVDQQLALAGGLRRTDSPPSPSDPPADFNSDNSVPVLTTIQALFERGWVVGGAPLEDPRAALGKM